MKISIKYKLTFMVFSIILFIMLLQNIGAIFWSEPYFLNKKENIMFKTFNSLAIIGNENKLLEEAEYHAYSENINITIINKNNKIIYSSFGTGIKYLQPYSLDFKTKPYIVENINKKTGRISSMLLGKGLNGDKIIIDTSISSIQSTADLLVNFNTYIIVIAIVPSLVIAYYFSKKIVKPVEEICQVTKDLSQLNFTHTLQEYKGKDEIFYLIQNINKLSTHLKIALDELQNDNISLKKNIDAQIEVENSRKQFIADVSHELKSPLALLTMYCEIIKSDDSSIDKNFYCNSAIDECLRMGNIVKNLLDISSLENKLKKIRVERVNFSDFIIWILAKNKVIFESNNIDYVQHITPDIYVDIDKFYFQQAIINLLFNALEYGTGKVVVRLYDCKNTANFSVFNTCLPISNKELQLLWNAFYRVDKARTQNENVNSGIGLHIVKTVVSAHHGQYRVETKDNGIEFTLKLKSYKNT